VRPGNVGSAVVSDKISDLDRTGSQLLLVSFIKAFERDGGEVGRRQKKLKRCTRCPSFMISRPALEARTLSIAIGVTLGSLSSFMIGLIHVILPVLLSRTPRHDTTEKFRPIKR